MATIASGLFESGRSVFLDISPAMGKASEWVRPALGCKTKQKSVVAGNVFPIG
ncbi:MAG: hypothetical protein MUC60_03195 [Oscillatoria sp. Prado101]|nr:hypothetical protein [Oscillatoria sp. Prado101]